MREQLPRASDYFTLDTIKRICLVEERRNALPKGFYSESVENLQKELKDLRKVRKSCAKRERDDLESEIQILKQRLDALKEEEISQIYEMIRTGSVELEMEPLIVKGKRAYTTRERKSWIISKIVLNELSNCYAIKFPDRNEIVEEIGALLDNRMTKVLVRLDIHHFFESIPQDRLMTRLENDNLLSKTCLKYIRSFLFLYNKMEKTSGVGLPRGICFSSHLSEIYLQPFDRKVYATDGVFMYHRYVDDIIILKSPIIGANPDYEKLLDVYIKELGLSFNISSDKRYVGVIHGDSWTSFTYLGYEFVVGNGHCQILLGQARLQKYYVLVKAIFDIYKRIASYRTPSSRNKYTDPLIQLMHRLNALTGNGHLDGHQSYIRTGIFYSNRCLTNLNQLRELDLYLANCVEDESVFCPPRGVLNYKGRDRAEIVQAIREKIKKEYSFVRGFRERRPYRWKDYSTILNELQHIYQSRIK